MKFNFKCVASIDLLRAQSPASVAVTHDARVITSGEGW